MPVEAKPRSSKPKLRRNWLLISFAGILVVLAIAAWLAFSEKATRVTVETLQSGPASRVLAVNGQIAAATSVQLRAAVIGTALDLPVDEGDQVKKGAVLLRLDAAQQEAMVRQAASALEQGIVRKTQASATFDRIRSLGANMARSTLEDAGRDMETASQEVELLEALLDQAKIQLDRYTITAPISGTVMSRSVDQGQLVDTTTPLFTLADLSRLVVQTDVDEAYAREIAVGQVATLQLVGAKDTLSGKVTFVSPKVDPTTGGLAVEIGFDEPLAAPVGLTVTANIVVESRPSALTVPRAALQDKVVFLLANGKTKKTPVEVIDWPAERLIVTKGLADGDRVIVDATGLADGQKVTEAAK